MKPIWAILSTTLCTATLAAGLIAGFYFMAGLERQPASELTAAPEPRPPVGRDIEHSALSTAATPSAEPFRPSPEAPSADVVKLVRCRLANVVRDPVQPTLNMWPT